MHRPQEQVREFHREVLGHEPGPTPALREAELRASLILEEAFEAAVAFVGSKHASELIYEAMSDMPTDKEPDLVEAIDALCDGIYVHYGAAEKFGVDLELFYDEVHRSNMAKAGGPVRADGKRLKPPGWTPPDLAAVLEKVRNGAQPEFVCGHGEDCDQCSQNRIYAEHALDRKASP